MDQADAIILVVEADVTRPEDVLFARRDIQARGGRVIGAVMNQVSAVARLADRISA